MTEPWLTKSEVARELRVSVKTIQRHVRPTAVVGGQNRYLMSDVRAQIAGDERDLPANVVSLRPRMRGQAV